MKSIGIIYFSVMIVLSLMANACQDKNPSSNDRQNADSVLSEHRYKFDTAVLEKEGAANFFIDSNSGKEYIANFRPFHDADTRLTRSVWIDKDVVAAINDYLMRKDLSGIRIYMAAYGADEHRDVPGRRVQGGVQTTLVIVPTSPRAGKYPESLSAHVDRWAIFPEKMRFGAANHGELCPTKCND